MWEESSYTPMTPSQAQIRIWRKDPVAFVRTLFGVEPDTWQIEALLAFANPNHRRISLQACAGPGKSAVLAWCGWNFLSCYGTKDNHPNAAVMSVTKDNLKDNLWKELSVWGNRSDYLKQAFTITKERIFSNDHPETWFLSARTWPRTADPEEQGRTLSGLHSKFILYLIDESGDINIAIQRAAEQGLSNCEFGKIVQAGNPTSQNGMLYNAAVPQRHMWYVVRITGDPDDPQRSNRIDIEWARTQIKLYGRDNPWVMAYILGQFPPTSINALLGIEDMELAMSRMCIESDYNFSQKRLGIDAAGDGADPWVIWPRQGLQSFTPVEMRNPKPQEVSARVAMAKAKWKSELEFFDDSGGWAGAAILGLEQAGINPVRVNFAGKATDPRFFNKRSEMLFKGAEHIKNGGALPNLPHIVREFTTPTYWFDRGKFRVVEKKQIKDLLGHSTDYFDAFGLTFAMEEMPASDPITDLLLASKQMPTDYDPFEPGRL